MAWLYTERGEGGSKLVEEGCGYKDGGKKDVVKRVEGRVSVYR
jgi:hypothetical protein